MIVRFTIVIVSAFVSIAGFSQDDTRYASIERLDKVAAPGAFFRIRLLLSPEFDSLLGDSTSIAKIKDAIQNRLSFDQDSVQSLTKDVSEKTSEQEAKALLNQVLMVQKEVAREVEVELEAGLPESEYAKVVRLQLGLLGLTSVLEDRRLASFLRLREGQLVTFRSIVADASKARDVPVVAERTEDVSFMIEAESSGSNAYPLRAPLWAVLDNEQARIFLDCEKVAKEYLAAQAKREQDFWSSRVIFENGEELRSE